MAINATLAPAGHQAAAPKSALVPCDGCHFLARVGISLSCGNKTRISCMPYKRPDKETVIFVRASDAHAGQNYHPQR